MKKDNQKLIDSTDYLVNSASAQDCTGLIPAGPQNDKEVEAYEEKNGASAFYSGIKTVCKSALHIGEKYAESAEELLNTKNPAYNPEDDKNKNRNKNKCFISIIRITI